MSSQKTKTTPDIIARECIAVRVRILSRVITKIYDEALRPLGLKTSQMNILVVTARLVVVRPAEICSRLKMDMSTVSRNVDRMKAAGWLKVVADEEDARARQIRLSRKGSKLLEKASPAWEEAQIKAKELLGPAGVTSLLEAIENVRRAA